MIQAFIPEMWALDIEVFSQHRGQGIAGPMLRALFNYAVKHGKGIRTGQFSDLGEKHVRPRIEKLEKEFKIPVIYH